MAKLSVAVLFLFFTLSLARTPLTQPGNDVTYLKHPSENDVIRFELANSLPESDDLVPTVSLPIKSDDEETRSVHPVPLTLVRFRPINRRFRLRSNLPFGLCGHHFRHRNPGSRRQIPFGNDMILSPEKNIDFDKFVYGIGVRQIPSDRFNFHHHHDENKKIWKFLDDREKFGKMKLMDSPHDEEDDHEQKISKFQITRDDHGKFGEIKSKNENQFHAHHVDDDDDAYKRSKLYAKHYGEDQYSFDKMKLRKRFHYKNGEEEEVKAEKENKWHKREKKKGGFMRGIRKFLHHYFD